MKNILFFVVHFNERGTDVALYDYAYYNEKILNNKSFIICFNLEKQKSIGWPTNRISYEKFNKSFDIIEINDFLEMPFIIEKYNIDYFYTIVHGCYEEIYQFKNKNIWSNCKTIKHCVFDTTSCDSDYNISISNFLNNKFNTNLPVIPHMINLPKIDDDLRSILKIPKNSIVLGRYGGIDQFNISFVHEEIKDFLKRELDVYFLFMNTIKFYEHPRIIYLEKNLDLYEKSKFINTCNIMIHAREMGETFGLSVGEFSSLNKPIITSSFGDLEHLLILKEKAIIYNTRDDLKNIFNNIKILIKKYKDWNCYDYYNPENIIKLFDEYIFNKKYTY